MSDVARVRDDFDRIAGLPHDACDHNARHHEALLRELPPRIGRALDVGCGTGEFSRALTAHADDVLGIDLSPEMIRVARERSRGLAGVRFEVADVTSYPLEPGSYDTVAAIATLHHLPMKEMLSKFVAALRPGGTLLVLELYDRAEIGDWIAGLVSLPADRIVRLWRTGRISAPEEVRRAWTQHAATDRYPPLRDVRTWCREILPGACIRRHLFWRYSIVWRKP